MGVVSRAFPLYPPVRDPRSTLPNLILASRPAKMIPSPSTRRSITRYSGYVFLFPTSVSYDSEDGRCWVVCSYMTMYILGENQKATRQRICLGSQQTTPSHHLGCSAHIGYIPFHRIHCRVGLENWVKTCRGDGIVARPEDWVMA